MSVNAAQTIRHAVEQVNALRQQAASDGALGASLTFVKHYQNRRFARTYQDLLQSADYASASRFFLEELYGIKDYARRDAQFARIASALQRLFPESVVQTALRLADLHTLSEVLDYHMAEVCLTPELVQLPGDERYVKAWRAVDCRADRSRQLELVLDLGQRLDKLTRVPGLRSMLRLMRRPARASNLGELQLFLETGFDTFAGMARTPGGTSAFLDAIAQREARLMATLFDAPAGEALAALGG